MKQNLQNAISIPLFFKWIEFYSKKINFLQKRIIIRKRKSRISLFSIIDVHRWKNQIIQVKYLVIK